MSEENKVLCRGTDGQVSEASWGRLVWTASRQIGNSHSMSFGRVTMRAGHGNPRHRHPNCEEILHVLAGRLEHSVAGNKYVLEAGDTLSIPQNVWHQARVIGERDAEVIICFSSADRLTEVAPQ